MAWDFSAGAQRFAHVVAFLSLSGKNNRLIRSIACFPLNIETIFVFGQVDMSLYTLLASSDFEIGFAI
jgi:hypothetical protein